MRKYSLLLSASLMFSLAYSQQVTLPGITPTSTVQECVQYINKKLKTYIGAGSAGGDTITNVQFTGANYFYQSQYYPSRSRTESMHILYQTHISDINWAAYKSVFAKPYNYSKSLSLYVVMNTAHPVTVQAKYYDFHKGLQTIGYPAYNTDTIQFNVALAEQTSVHDMDIAFKRLSQITKENPSLFKSEGFKPKLIEGKASFNETIDFINNNFPKQLSYYGTSYDKYGNYEGAVDLKYENFTVARIHNTDSMIITWYDKYVVPKYLAFEERRITKFVSIRFSMKDIEKVTPFNYSFLNSFVTLEKAREATFPCGISLHAKQGKNLFTLYVYNFNEEKATVQNVSNVGFATGGYSNKENIETVLANVQNSQLFKAFNHLRNLCGAPDPLKFD